MRMMCLHLDAPLMSFGGVQIDNKGPTEAWPARSMLTGMLGNALGWSHGDTARLQSLQDRLEHAVREDRPGQRLRDFQTVDLGQPHLVDAGWTRRGKPEKRGGASGATTHIRERHYWAERVMTVVLHLSGNSAPGLDDLAGALRRPARPLFLGRKCCLPARPILAGFVEAETLASGALNAPWPAGVAKPPDGCVRVWFPTDVESTDGRTSIARDQRDWGSQLHAGRRLVRTERHSLPEEATDVDA
jgi:CRISPR system Cascade subunit CasD